MNTRVRPNRTGKCHAVHPAVLSVLRKISLTTARPANSPAQRHAKVRQALMVGTDRTAIIKSDLTGIPWPDVPLDNHFFMNSQAGYQDNMGDLGTYDAGKAKSLLTSDGPEIATPYPLRPADLDSAS